MLRSGGLMLGLLLLLGSAASSRAEPVVEASIIDPRVIPDRLEIDRGTTVVWTNNGTVNHTVTSDRGLWDSGAIRRRGQFTWTFDQSGEFRYHCELHPSIKGTVVVAGGAPARPAPPPPAVAAPAPEGPVAAPPARQNVTGPEPTAPPSIAAAPEPSPAPAEPTPIASRLEPPAPTPASLPAAPPPVAPALSAEPVAPLPRPAPLPALRIAVQRLLGDALHLLRLTPALEGQPSVSWRLGGATLEVAAGATAVARAMYASIGAPPPIPPPPGTVLVGPGVYRFASADGSSLAFETPVAVALEYRAETLAAVPERTLALALWDTNPGQWQVLPSSVDGERRRVTASVDRLTALALVGRP
ncbi:MAG: cupredoxin domain-containing protein [Chloroflexi bacterium]|nr:cupredoxin domain-containing protein [Chloroflexota bacterium]